MLKKSITYENPFTQQKVTEEHYFHISKADLVEMEMEEYGAKYTDKEGNELTGMRAKIQRISDAEDGKQLLAAMKDMVLRAYGKRTEDNKFRKNKDIREEFESSEAFSQLLFELCTDAEKAAEFTNGIAPSGLDEEAAKIIAKAAKEQASSEVATPGVVASSPTEPIAPEDVDQHESSAEKDPTGLTEETVPQVLTLAQAGEMDNDELAAGLASGKYKLS